jgi:hypothetical protein
VTITYTCRQLALVAQIAAIYDPTLKCDLEPSDIPPVIQRYFNLKQDGGMFTWMPR